MAEDWGFVARALRRERRGVVAALAAGLLVTLSSVGLAATSAWLIVRAAQRPLILSLTVPMGLVQLFALAKAAGRYLERTMTHRAALGAMAHVRADVALTLEPLLPAGVGPESARVVDQVLGDVERVQDLLTAVAGPLITSVVAGLVSVVVLGVIAPVTALVLLGAMAIDAVVLPMIVSRWATSSSHELDVVHRELIQLFDQVAQSGEEFIMVGASRALQRRLATLEDRRDAAQSRHRALTGWASAALIVVSGLSVLAVAGISIESLRRGHASPALLAVPALTVATVLELVGGFVGNVTGVARDRAAVRRLAELRTRRWPVRDPAISVEPPKDGASLSAHEVEHTYDGARVLADVSMDCQPGDVIVLEGPSGSGKTTWAHLLVKFLDPTHGEIFLGGVGYGFLTGDAVRSRVGMVDDTPYVFAASLAENLRVAAPDASDEQLEGALREAELGGFFDTLDHGLATPLGGESTGLSGGEQRRLGVAREFLSGRRIAIFDEPTEGLDDETARRLLDALREHYRDGVAIIISHHDARRWAHARVWRLAEGRLLGDGLPSAARATNAPSLPRG